ncbi:MAG: Por secretion system C-terminal sorting protein [Bacteroidetes bacterium]|nr:Por secretion system C-terminal sorting protein [Bacteroidota bacterium]
MGQNYPNPFNPATKISFTIPTSGKIRLTVTNLLGQEVATLANGFEQAGNHEVTFAASHLQSGIYFYTLKAGNFSETKKLALMK